MEQKLQLASLISSALHANKQDLSRQFSTTRERTNTRFFVLDDLLPREIPAQAYSEFPLETESYLFRNSFRERKFTFAKLNEHSSRLIEDLTDAFQEKEVISILSEIAQIPDLEGDPSLYAGGISRMDRGHFLNPHLDNSHDGDGARYRRLNILYYVTPDISETDGGNLELWDDKVKSPTKIPAFFNRLVVMETNIHSWHSVDPVKSDISRRCVSNYYFSKSSPELYEYRHLTQFMGRPEQALRRAFCRVDNTLRNIFFRATGISRGKRLSRTYSDGEK